MAVHITRIYRYIFSSDRRGSGLLILATFFPSPSLVESPHAPVIIIIILNEHEGRITLWFLSLRLYSSPWKNR